MIKVSEWFLFYPPSLKLEQVLLSATKLKKSDFLWKCAFLVNNSLVSKKEQISLRNHRIK